MRHELVGYDEGFGSSIATKLLLDIELLRVHRECEIGWQRPWGRGPDDETRLLRQRTGNDWKLNPDSGVLPVLVFHLCFRERSLRAAAPEDWFERLIDQAVFDEDCKRPENFRLVRRIHREVGMFPIAENPQAFELLALNVDKLARKSFRTLAHLERRKAARFLHHFVLNRETVAVPSWDIRTAKASHGFRFHHQIFQDLVERSSHMDVAVGERRSIVKDEKFGPAPRLLDAGVKV